MTKRIINLEGRSTFTELWIQVASDNPKDKEALVDLCHSFEGGATGSALTMEDDGTVMVNCLIPTEIEKDFLQKVETLKFNS